MSFGGMADSIPSKDADGATLREEISVLTSNIEGLKNEIATCVFGLKDAGAEVAASDPHPSTLIESIDLAAGCVRKAQKDLEDIRNAFHALQNALS